MNQGDPFLSGMPMPPPPPPSVKKTSTGRTVLIVIAAIFVLGSPFWSAIAFSSVTRYMRRTKTREASERLERMCVGLDRAIAQSGQLPPSAPRTPEDVPKGTRIKDGPGTWDQPGWQAMGFSIAEPHYYSYEFVSDGTIFTARAIGDLDGDGVFSTFERAGALQSLPGQPRCRPLWFDQEIE